MTHEEIRKLLGGYATNTLTDAEKKALFDAALEDQDLFNALHDDQPLRELLSDPVTRAEVRQALDAQPSGAAPAHWWSRWWTWGGAAAALASGMFLFVMLRSNAPTVSNNIAALETPKPAPPQAELAPAPPPPAEVARKLPAPRSPAAKPRAAATLDASIEKQNEKKESAAASAPALQARDQAAPPAVVAEQQQQSPPAFAPQQQQAQALAPKLPPPQSPGEQAKVATSAPAVSAFRQAEAASGTAGALSGNIAALRKNEAGALRCTVMRLSASGVYAPADPGSLQPGDTIRLEVTSQAPGFLSVARVDASGKSTILIPAAGERRSVAPGSVYTIPEAPIQLTGEDRKLRIVLAPVIPAKSARASSGFASPQPVLLEIPLGPQPPR